jgi:hypothetical protein
VSPRPDRGAPSELEEWAASRAPGLIARAEEEAVAALRGALVAASLRTGMGDAAETRPTSTAPHAPLSVPPQAPLPPASVSTKPRATSTSADTRELLWAYCVLRDADPVPDGLEGITASPVERVQAGGLVALVSRVPAADFAAEPLTHNLNDLGWLERIARGHEAVLDTALAQSTIVPLRMCTIFEGEEGVREMLERRQESLSDALDALEGRFEWAVKVLVDRERLMDAARPPGDEAEQAAAAGEGGAYLQRRRSERGTREAASRLAAETAQQVHARLQDWAIDARTRPPQNRELSRHEGEMVLNAAYLVERARTDELRQIIAELEEHHRGLGARIELTGPWPPYNFVPSGDASALA